MWTRIRSWLRALVGRRAFETSMSLELRHHMEAYAVDLEREGLSPTEAARRARLELGGVESLKDSLREARGLRMWDTLRQDLRAALRVQRKRPGLTAGILFTLALAIGATSAIFAVVYGVLLRPLPVADGSRLVGIFHTRPDQNRWREPVSGVRFEAWRSRADVLAGAAASQRTDLDLLLPDGTERVTGELVSSNFFQLLGTPTLVGRTVSPSDDSLTAGPVPCVISEQFWRRAFLADQSVIGRSIATANVTMTIVGVMPDSFGRWRDPTELWVPYRLTPSLLSPATLNSDGYRLFQVIARLRPSVTIAQAHLAIQTVDAGLDQILTGSADERVGVDVVSLHDTTTDAQFRQSLWLLLAVSGLLLLLAATNVASLLLARGVARQRELSLRRAMGATTGRLVRQLTTEGAMLGLVSGGAGLLLTHWMIPVLIVNAPTKISQSAMVRLDAPTWVFALSVSCVVVIVVGILPALFAQANTSVDLRAQTLTGNQVSGIRVLSLLVSGQLTVAMPVIVAAVIMAASFARLQLISPGFEPKQLLTATIGLPAGAYPTPTEVSAVQERLVEGLSAVPAVTAVAIGSGSVQYLAPNASPAGVSITIEGGRRFLNGEAGQSALTPGRTRVSPEYVQALGLRLVTGRHLTGADRAGSPPVALVNQTMARLHWPGESPIGKRVNFENVRPNRPLAEPWTEIVGVVSDARQYQFDVPPRPEIYTPLAQSNVAQRRLSVLIRSATPPDVLTPTVRQAIRRIDPQAPVFDIRTMTSIIDEATADTRYATLLIGLCASLTLLLAATGIHGLGAFAASQRTREVAIRMALGATGGNVLRLVLTGALGPAMLGIATGLGVAAAGTQIIASTLYGVTPSHGVFLASAAVILLLVSMLAAYGPARRATRIDPIVALRND